MTNNAIEPTSSQSTHIDSIQESIGWDPESDQEDNLLLGASLVRLQKWLINLGKKGFLSHKPDGTVQLHSSISSQFGLGLTSENAFIVMQEEAAQWAKNMPWSNACMYENLPTLYVVIDNIKIDGIDIHDFGISFLIPDFAKANKLSKRTDLELRDYINTKIGPRINSKYFALMPILIIDESESAFKSKKKKLGRK